MIKVATLADKRAIEAEMPVSERWAARSLYQQAAKLFVVVALQGGEGFVARQHGYLPSIVVC